jgi:hypothetical protein
MVMLYSNIVSSKRKAPQPDVPTTGRVAVAGYYLVLISISGMIVVGRKITR